MNDPEHLLPPNRDDPVILLVDDEALVLNIARIALEAERYFVLTAENGVAALELFHKFPGTIHVVVSDIKMPKMDGVQLREQLLSERPGVKVLLMSGQVEAPVEDCPFLRKPFHINVLKERVRQLLDTPLRT